MFYCSENHYVSNCPRANITPKSEWVSSKGLNMYMRTKEDEREKSQDKNEKFQRKKEVK